MIRLFVIRISAAVLVFSISFLAVTAVCDWICRHSSYYEDASHEAVQMVD